MSATTVTIELDGGCARFRPGGELSGRARWELETPPDRVEVRLVWGTEGEGEPVRTIVDRHRLDSRATAAAPFSFRLPAAPYTFIGRLFRVGWVIELEIQPGVLLRRHPITVSPTGFPIESGEPHEEKE